MGVFTFNIYDSDVERRDEVKHILSHLHINNLKLEKIMAQIDELAAKVAELQGAVDAEQAQIAELLASNVATIAALNETIAALQAQVTEAGTAEQRQAIVDQLTAIKADIEGTV